METVDDFNIAVIKGISPYPGIIISSVQSIINNNPYIETKKSPIDNSEYCTLSPCYSFSDMEYVISVLKDASIDWKNISAPRRGELVRRIGQQVRDNKTFLANIITLETGKTKNESLGEVQEWIDICDFAVGLSRQLHGLTIVSERTHHKLLEQWHPLGIVGIVSAFNFPIAVWAWNAMLALICGNTIIWKPSEKTPLCSHYAHTVMQLAIDSMGNEIPRGISALLHGNSEFAKRLASNKNINLISATGSTNMGKEISSILSNRLGKSLLELGGNNAMIVTENADIEMAIRAATFSLVGTNGQRCTTLRRLILHRSISSEFIKRLNRIIRNIKIGDPREDDVLMGPLIDEASYNKMQYVLNHIRHNNIGSIFGGERITKEVPIGGYYVRPALVLIPSLDRIQPEIMKDETFAPILYIMMYEEIQDAIKINNDTNYGLSSSIFTNDLRESELFMSSLGSDCGMVNVNAGTSGAEIGGAFGGEKDSGGGRESGSDCWKNYMRRQTVTINYGKELPLSQGIEFEIK